MSFRENRKGKDLSGVYEDELYEFLSLHYKDEMLKILEEPKAKEWSHFSILIQHVRLNQECDGVSEVSQGILRNPDAVLKAGEKAARRAMLNLYEASEDKKLVMKHNVHLRIHNLTEEEDVVYTVFPGCEEKGNFMTLIGTVVKTSKSGLIESKKEYKCSKCKQINVVEGPISRYYVLPKTLDRCQNLCVGAKLEAIVSESDGHGSQNRRFKDYQEIKLQEQIKNEVGPLPKALWVILEDDLVDTCKPGDDVVITGTLFFRVKHLKPGQPIDGDLAFKANHVKTRNEQRTSVLLSDSIIKSFEDFWKQHEENPFEGRNTILRSFCPQVYGMYLVKLAICVVLAGGVSKDQAGTQTRGESHLLLVGDPGTGKSQLLKYASKLMPRSVFTTGTGTTTAGLTVGAIKENGTWHLEAGALVLADGGVCCIDEFSNIKQHDRVSIHEAMEQQTISIAKAGMVSKLSTKCTIIAATNPGLGKYDPDEDIEVNVGLPSPLLSRFDLVLVLRDAQNDAWDNFLCDFILQGVNMFSLAAKNAMKSGIIWDTEKLQSYLVFIKDKQPTMSEEAEDILGKYYNLQRQSDKRVAARTTVRLYESLRRLAEGHARLMYRDVVLVHDAVIAISLVETSMQTSALFTGSTNPLHVTFPEDHIKEYYGQAEKILQALGFSQLWQIEKIYLDNLILRQRNKICRPPPPPPPVNRPSVQPSQSNFNKMPVVLAQQNSELRENVVNSLKPIQSQASKRGNVGDVIPENFFTTDGMDENVPCSGRIVTSTQSEGLQAGTAKANANETEGLSPIRKASQKMLNVVHTPLPREDFAKDNDSPLAQSKRKRKRPERIEDSSDSEAENLAEEKTETSVDTEADVESGDRTTVSVTADTSSDTGFGKFRLRESSTISATGPEPDAGAIRFRNRLACFQRNAELD